MPVISECCPNSRVPLTCTLQPQFQSHVLTSNESESARGQIVSAKQLGMVRSEAAKVARFMADAQRQAKANAEGGHSAGGAAMAMSPKQQQAAVKAAMVHAWRGVSCLHDLIAGLVT